MTGANNRCMNKEAAFSWPKFLLGLESRVGKGLHSLWGLSGDAAKAVSKTPGFLLSLMGLGAATGVTGAVSYDVIKERLSREDPQTKFNAEIEAMYNLKGREIEDSKWMAGIRAKRDRLLRDHKKMSTEEYAKEYHELEDMLNERSVV